MRTAVGLGIALSVAVCGGCENSILRNAAEAGLETVLEEPLPTPTATAWKPATDTSAGSLWSARGSGP
jgi:hypothetical protein